MIPVELLVIDSESMVHKNIYEFSCALSQARRRVVGFDVKFDSETKIAELLILYTANRCLITQVCHLKSEELSC